MISKIYSPNTVNHISYLQVSKYFIFYNPTKLSLDIQVETRIFRIKRSIMQGLKIEKSESKFKVPTQVLKIESKMGLLSIFYLSIFLVKSRYHSLKL